MPRLGPVEAHMAVSDDLIEQSDGWLMLWTITCSCGHVSSAIRRSDATHDFDAHMGAEEFHIRRITADDLTV